MVALETGEDYDNLDISSQSFDEQMLTKTRISNSSFSKCSFSVTDFSEASFINTTFKSCNFTGAVLAQAYFKNVTFIDCKFYLSTLMFSEQKTVSYQGCQISDVKFGETKFFGKCLITDCQLEKADFHAIKIDKSLDFSGSSIISLSGVTSLKKAIFTQVQLIALAPYMAVDLGINLTD